MAGTRTLVVMRHAKSSWRTSEPDVRRPLSERGTRDAVVAGQRFSTVGLDVVLCSAATRAQQTWQCLRMGGARCADVRVEERLYGAWADEVLDLLRGVPADAGTVLVIGHEPTLSELILSLAAPSNLTATVADKFPTAAVAVLRLDGEWDALAPGTARLVSLEVPRG